MFGRIASRVLFIEARRPRRAKEKMYKRWCRTLVRRNVDHHAFRWRHVRKRRGLHETGGDGIRLFEVSAEDVSLLDWYSIRVEIQQSVQHGKYGKYRVLFWRLLVGQK
jgi:hypothetical protein